MSTWGARFVRVAFRLLPVVTITLIGLCVPETGTTAQGPFQVTFINVGQGDSAWLRTPDGWDILIDGGDPDHGDDVVSYLQSHGVLDIEVLVLTHPDDDHVGGLVDVLNQIQVGEARTNCQEGSAQSYQDFETLLQQKGITEYCVRDGDTFSWGADVSAVVVHPVDPLMPGTNNNSVVLRVSYGTVDFLFTGDIEQEAETAILGRGATLEAEVLKVPHHGSNSSSTEGFLGAVSPQDAVISVGKNNYGHPHEEVLQRLEAHGTTIRRTDKVGGGVSNVFASVVMESDGETYQVRDFRRRSFCPLGMVPHSQVWVDPDCCRPAAPGTQEYVCFTNRGGARENMTNWTVRDEANHTYTFGSFGLGPGATVRLHTGHGADSATDVYWNRNSAVWNNDGDTVYLHDKVGNLVDSHSY